MSDNLLITWSGIHEDLFCDGMGKRIISLSTLQQTHGPKLKACGAVFRYRVGHQRTYVVAGWRNVIQNYFIKLGQETEAKKAKLANSYYTKVQELQE